MKLLLFTNILTPYRIAFYDHLFHYCNSQGNSFKVLVMSRTEENRNWFYEQFEREYTYLLEGKKIKIGGYNVNINKGIAKWIDSFKPDVVIAAGSYIHPSLWLLVNNCKKHSIPILFWSESHLNTERNYSKTRLFIRESIRSRIYKKFDGFCFAGKLSKQFIQKYARKKAAYIFLPNLIDDNFYSAESDDYFFDSKEKYTEYLEGNCRKYIIPARLSSDKGIVEFLNLFKEVNNKNIRIFIAGDGELENKIKEIIKKENLDVILLGFVQKDEMRFLYHHVDGFILPSKVDPNPLSCIEALWCGLPLLVSEHVGNYPEVVKQGFNGFVFSYDDSNGKTIIDHFFNEDDVWYSNAKRISKTIAETNYSMKKQTIRFCDEVENLITENKNGENSK